LEWLMKICNVLGFSAVDVIDSIPDAVDNKKDIHNKQC